ncbi:hypothetical protein ACLKA7_011970 [Drosophila subpalustris]
MPSSVKGKRVTKKCRSNHSNHSSCQPNQTNQPHQKRPHSQLPLQLSVPTNGRWFRAKSADYQLPMMGLPRKRKNSNPEHKKALTRIHR